MIYIAKIHSWPDGEKFVEVVSNIDYLSCDALADIKQYQDNDLIYNLELIENQIVTMKKEFKAQYYLIFGHELTTRREVHKVLRQKLDNYPMCPYCGEKSDVLEWNNPDSWFTEEKYCSEHCASEAYYESLEEVEIE